MESKIKLYRKLKNVNYKKRQFNETPNYLNTIEKNTPNKAKTTTKYK